MSFQQSLSGLNAANKSIDSVSNDIANAATVGYKRGELQFSSVYGSTMSSSDSSSIGGGVALANARTHFDQSGFTPTGNPLDTAINGEGYFYRMVSSIDNQEPMYSRNGQFEIEGGFLVNKSENGALVTGYPSGVASGKPMPIKINTFIPPVKTSSAQLNLQLDAGSLNKTAITDQFDHTDSDTYRYSTSMVAYDGLGNPHDIQTFYREVRSESADKSSKWEVYATVDGQPSPALAANGVQPNIGKLSFGDAGSLVGDTTLSISVPGGLSAAPFTVTVDYAGTTQLHSENNVVSPPIINGSAPSTLSRCEVTPQGDVIVTYSNGMRNPVGTIALCKPSNVNGMRAIGNNLYTASAAAGEVWTGKPKSDVMILSGKVEQSNVDMTTSLVNLNFYQGLYQANAKGLKAQDTMLQSVLNSL